MQWKIGDLARIRNSPDVRAKPEFQKYIGEVVEIVGLFVYMSPTLGPYHGVIHPDGTRFWVSVDALEPIEPPREQTVSWESMANIWKKPITETA